MPRHSRGRKPFRDNNPAAFFTALRAGPADRIQATFQAVGTLPAPRFRSNISILVSNFCKEDGELPSLCFQLDTQNFSFRGEKWPFSQSKLTRYEATDTCRRFPKANATGPSAS